MSDNWSVAETSFSIHKNHFDCFNATTVEAFEATLPWSNKEPNPTGVWCVPMLWPISGLLKGAKVSWEGARTGKYHGCWCAVNATPVRNGDREKGIAHCAGDLLLLWSPAVLCPPQAQWVSPRPVCKHKVLPASTHNAKAGFDASLMQPGAGNFKGVHQSCYSQQRGECEAGWHFFSPQRIWNFGGLPKGHMSDFLKMENSPSYPREGRVETL